MKKNVMRIEKPVYAVKPNMLERLCFYIGAYEMCVFAYKVLRYIASKDDEEPNEGFECTE